MPEPTSSSATHLVKYNPEWPRVFLQLRDRIWPHVCDVAIGIEHVGSTSIPGMAAKPVIDLDIVIVSRNDLPNILPRLRGLGYQHRGDLGIEDREAFKAPENQPAHHLYVCAQNSLALKNHLAVRDCLRTHPSEAAAYSTLKKQLEREFPNERERYTEGKTDFFLSILEQCGFSTEESDSIRHANQP